MDIDNQAVGNTVSDHSITGVVRGLASDWGTTTTDGVVCAVACES